MVKYAVSMFGAFVVAVSVLISAGCAAPDLNEELCENCTCQEVCDCNNSNRCNPKCFCSPARNCIQISQTMHAAQLLGAWTNLDVPSGIKSEIQFLPESHVTGNTGLNGFNSSYIFSGRAKIRFAPLAMSEMAGSEDAMKFEQAFVNNMAAVTSFEIDGDKLTFYAENVDVLHFERMTIE